MQKRNLATAAIASALLLFGGLSSASALPTGAITDPSQAAAPSNPEAGAGIVKVRRGYYRGRRHFRRRHFRVGIRRGGYRSFYRFRRHRYYGRPYYGFRSRYSRRCYNCGYSYRRNYRYY